MKILGIDPGSSRIGFGLIEKNRGALTFKKTGVIEIKEKGQNAKLFILGAQFKKLLTKTKPDIIAIEKLFFTKNIKTGIAVAEARGLLMYLSMQYIKTLNPKHETLNPKHETLNLILEFTPQQIKQAVTNYGGADKKAVARMVGLLLNEPKLKELDDATDALSIAICAANHIRNK